jgi:hypothetical protein
MPHVAMYSPIEVADDERDWSSSSEAMTVPSRHVILRKAEENYALRRVNPP